MGGLHGDGYAVTITRRRSAELQQFHGYTVDWLIEYLDAITDSLIAW